MCVCMHSESRVCICIFGMRVHACLLACSLNAFMHTYPRTHIHSFVQLCIDKDITNIMMRIIVVKLSMRIMRIIIVLITNNSSYY